MLFSPAAERNKQPILETLQTVLPAQGSALEIASGSGQHICWFARHLPLWQWQPSDTYPAALESIAAYAKKAGLVNVRPAIVLDVLTEPWLPEHVRFDAIYCANMLHISPPASGLALLRGSARHLVPGGVLITYGPFLENEVPTSPGNLEFDRALRAENPLWGLRQKEELQAQALQAGLVLAQRISMPANNLLLLWRKKPE